MKRLVGSVVAFGSVVCILAPLARAGTVTFQVTGVVTEIRDPYGEIGQLVRLGDDFVATYSFLGSTPDSVLYDPRLGWYDDAVDSITGAVGLIHFSADDPFGQISIGNYKVSIGDYYSIGLGGLSTSTFGFPTEFLLNLQDPSGGVFVGDALPLAPPPLDAFELRRFNLQIGSDRMEIIGRVTSLVPEPTSLVVLAISATALLTGRRKSRQGRTGTAAGVAVLCLFSAQPLLAQQWTGGPVLIGGDDADDHFSIGTGYPTGKNYIRHGFNFLGTHVQNGKTLVVCIGCNPGKATSSFNAAFDASMLSPTQGGAWSTAVPLIQPVDIQAFFLNSNQDPLPNIQDTGIIYLPSSHIEGGITNAQIGAVNSRSVELTNFVKITGGGLFTHTLVDRTNGWAWLATLAPHVQPVDLPDTLCPLGLTCAATRAFFPTMTVDEEVSIAFANQYHTYFQPASGFSDLSGLTVVTRADTGHAVILGAPYVPGGDCNANFARDDCDLRWNVPRFTLSGELSTGAGPRSVIVSASLPSGNTVPLDLNNDGQTDLITANAGGGTLTIYLGSVSASGYFFFTIPPSPPSGLGTYNVGGGNPYALAAADFDGNGDVDVAVTHDLFPGLVRVLLNLGRNSLGAWRGFTANAPTYSVGNRPLSITAADFDGDLDVDVITANDAEGSLSILHNNGSGVFTLANTIDAGTSGPKGIAVGDLDLDGDLDIVAAPGTESKLWFFPNTGSLNFGPRQDFEVGVNNNPVSVVIGNFNDDSYPDVVTGPGNFNAAHHLTILVNAGLNGGSWLGFNVVQGPAIPTATAADSLIPLDLNHDRRTDIAWAFSTSTAREFWVFAQDPFTHEFITPRASSCYVSTPTEFYPISGYVRGIASGLFNADFRQDVAVLSELIGSGTVHVFVNDSGPPFSQDCDLNQNPDDCEGLATLRPKDASGEAGFPKQRFLSIVPDNPGRDTALRVTPIRMPSWKFMNLIGTTLWATHQPQCYCETSGIAQCPCGLNPTTFLAGRLDCSPMVRVWNTTDPLSMYHGAPGEQISAIVPGATYMVQTFADGCDFTREPNYLPPTLVSTSRYGDIVGLRVVIPPNLTCTSAPCWTAPDGGSPSVTTDVVAVLDKFANRMLPLIKVRADLEPAAVDLKINISDVTEVLNAFRSLPYRFPPPTTPLCP